MTSPTSQPAASQPATHTVTITLADGSSFDHTAEALSYWHESDGAIVVEAACCGQIGGMINCPPCGGSGRGPAGEVCNRCKGTGQTRDEDTRSRHSIYDIARPVSLEGVIVDVDVQAEITAHVQRVAEHHAAVHKARSLKLNALMKPQPAKGEAKTT